jgi:uridine kinase
MEKEKKEMDTERYLQVLAEIDRLLESDREVILVAIDGRCASGKTTLGNYLKQHYDCNLFHMDDFFPQPYQRTEERLSEPGGNLDRERFQQEVLQPLMEGKDVLYRAFNCKTLDFNPTVTVPFKRLNIIEGAYSQHPYFLDVYDLKVFCDVDPEDQLARISKRNPDALEAFRNKWIPREEAYFNEFNIREGNLIVSTPDY